MKNKDIIKNWERDQEKQLEWEEHMKNWWKVELRDAAASGMRGLTVRDWDELKSVAVYSLEKLGYDPNNYDLDEAAEIISVYVEIENNLR